MAGEKHIMVIHETALQSWLRDAGTLAMFVMLIGIGIWIGSAPLQWVGAFIGIVAIYARAANAHKFVSISEARKRLDEIEGSA